MKVLFITYYWPPAGGVSAQRIIHFVKNLSEMGVDCHVIHPKNPSYYQEDHSFSKLLPKEITTHPVEIKDITSLVKKVPNMKSEGNIKSSSGGALSKLSKWLRANVFIPDPKANWIKPVVRKAITLLEQGDFDLVFTNGTPHSVHLSGLRLKQKFNLPWIADFRDPWTKIDYFEKMPLTARSLNKHKALENQVVNHADICLTVSPSWRDGFVELGAKNAVCITNGYDQVIENKKETDFLISHVGSLHGDRSLDDFIDAFLALMKSETTSSPTCKLSLVGNLSADTIEMVKQHIPKQRLHLPGILTHKESKEWIAKSSAVLLPINQSQDAQGRIPAKLYEYLAAKKPIIVLGSSDGDAASIVKEVNAGKCFENGATQAILAFLIQLREQETTNMPEYGNVEKYSRENTAKQLYALMKTIIIKA